MTTPFQLSGIIPILVTPFTSDGVLDETSLRNEVDWTIEAGVHGLGIALGSEIYKLSESERDAVTRIVVDQVRNRVPVVVNTGAPASHLAAHYSQRAEALGASAVMVTPPPGAFPTQTVVEVFRHIARHTSLPIVLQDTSATPIPAQMIVAITNACPTVTHAKIETQPSTTQVLRAVEAAGDRVGIIGGAGGGYLLEELRRGAIGTMPFPSTAHAFVEVWNAWQAGDATRATEIFARRIQPLLHIPVGSLGAAHLVHKLALHRQGVIRDPYVRPPSDDLDATTRDELDTAFAAVGWA